LYVPVSEIRFQAIVSGKIDLRDTFSKAEDNFVFKVTINKTNQNNQIENITCSAILESYLPEANEFIESNTKTLQLG
jgi:hypothetical protein